MCGTLTKVGEEMVAAMTVMMMVMHGGVQRRMMMRRVVGDVQPPTQGEVDVTRKTVGGGLGVVIGCLKLLCKVFSTLRSLRR